MNCISAIGFRPLIANPMLAPTIADSERGVSNTCLGYFLIKPSVTLKTPPSTPTSSPKIRARLSFASTWSMAWFRACTIVSLAMLASKSGLEIFELLLQFLRHLRVMILENIFWDVGGLLGFSDCLLDDLVAFRLERSLLLVVPEIALFQKLPHPGDRTLAEPLLLLFSAAILPGVVGCRVRALAIRIGLDHHRALSLPGALSCFLRGEIDRENVIAVHQHAGKAVGDGLLGECLRRGLQAPWQGDGPLVVHAEENRWSLEHSAKVHGLMELPF